MEFYHKERFRCIVNNEGLCAIRSLLSLDLILLKCYSSISQAKLILGNLGGQSSSLSA